MDCEASVETCSFWCFLWEYIWIMTIVLFQFMDMKPWYSLPALWVERTEDDGVDSVVSPEEQPAGTETVCMSMWIQICICTCLDICEHSLPLVVSERDPLCRHFKMDDSGCWRRVLGERKGGRLLNRLLSRQRLQLHRAQVPHVTCCSNTNRHTFILFTDTEPSFMCVS